MLNSREGKMTVKYPKKKAAFERAREDGPRRHILLGTSKTPRKYRDVMQTDMAAYEKICASMREKGIEYEQDPREPWFVCAAHSEADVGEALEALRDTVKKRKRAR
jgi:glutamate-1-semialdehyde aminotransferase